MDVRESPKHWEMHRQTYSDEQERVAVSVSERKLKGMKTSRVHFISRLVKCRGEGVRLHYTKKTQRALRAMRDSFLVGDVDFRWNES